VNEIAEKAKETAKPKPKSKPKPKPTVDDLRRLIGYLILTFTAIFVFLPFIWIGNLLIPHPEYYTKWLICSALILVVNVVFYFWRYPRKWLANLLVLGFIDLILVAYEYFWLINA